LRAAACLALAVGCGRAAPPGEQPREEKAELVEMRRDGAPPPAMAPAAAVAPAVMDEADFGGRGVAGGAAGGLASVPVERAPDAPRAAGFARRPRAGAPPDAAATPPSAAGAEAAQGAPAAGAPMLIRTGSASVEVDSLDAAVARVRALAAHLGGYVANASLAVGREQVRSATLELRIPAPRFDELVNGLAPFGRVERVDVRAEDVGEEFVDVSARVGNARRLEARLVELLARRTGKLEEVLAVERELARVREEVERYEGRLRYLRTRAATSTLTVTVHERAPLLAATPNATPVADAFRAAGRNFVALLTAVIAASGVWAPVGALAYGAWRWRRRGAARAALTRPAAPSAASAS
jgi:hypothetical protein